MTRNRMPRHLIVALYLGAAAWIVLLATVVFHADQLWLTLVQLVLWVLAIGTATCIGRSRGRAGGAHDA